MYLYYLFYPESKQNQIIDKIFPKLLFIYDESRKMQRHIKLCLMEILKVTLTYFRRTYENKIETIFNPLT